MESNNKGSFIVLEGPDGSGKTTLAKKVVEELKACGVKAIYSREPGGSPLAEKIRILLKDPENSHMHDMCELFLFMASRCDFLTNVISPAVSEGIVVVCDRFTDSTIAYQGYGNESPMADIETLLEMLPRGECLPDLVINLDVDIHTSLQRLLERPVGECRIENKGVEYTTRVLNGYHSLMRNEHDDLPRYVVDTIYQGWDEVLEDILIGIAEADLPFSDKVPYKS